MIPRLKASLGLKELLSALSFSKKNAILAFEKRFADLMKARYALAFPYGRTALSLGIEALHIQNKEIICPAYTCVVVAHAITYSNNTAVFVDSCPFTYNMDLTLVEKAINENTGAIIVTSIFGTPVDLEKITDIQNKYPHIKIIQDCAHSFGAEWQGNLVSNHGDFAIYGLNISKIMTSIFGGMLTANNFEIYQQIKTYRDKKLRENSFKKSLMRCLYFLSVYIAFNKTIYSIIYGLEKRGWLNRFVKYYDDSRIDMPKDYLEKMTPIEARVGLAQCDKYESIIHHRKKLARYYENKLKDYPFLKLPAMNAGATFSHFVIQTKLAAEIISYFEENNIQLGTLIDYHIPSMRAYQKNPYFSQQVSESLPGQMINLPIHTGVSQKDAEKIIDTFRAFFSIYTHSLQVDNAHSRSS